MTALLSRLSVEQAMIDCCADTNIILNGTTHAQRMTTDIFGNDFHICMDKANEELVTWPRPWLCGHFNTPRGWEGPLIRAFKNQKVYLQKSQTIDQRKFENLKINGNRITISF